MSPTYIHPFLKCLSATWGRLTSFNLRNNTVRVCCVTNTHLRITALGIPLQLFRHSTDKCKLNKNRSLKFCPETYTAELGQLFAIRKRFSIVNNEVHNIKITNMWSGEKHIPKASPRCFKWLWNVCLTIQSFLQIIISHTNHKYLTMYQYTQLSILTEL